MTYPLSTGVTAGQPTAADHYNNLRADALYLGNTYLDSKNLGTYLSRQAANLTIVKIAATRVRVPYVSVRPACVVINNCLLKISTAADLPAGIISGMPGIWYIFAVRTAGSTTFTLTANSVATESTDQLLIGECYFDGSDIGYIKCYFNDRGFPDPDYDSGWFAVAANNIYTRAHKLGVFPSLVILTWTNSSSGTNINVPVSMVYATTPSASVYDPLYYDDTNIYIKPGDSSSYDATCHSRYAQSASGYYRVRAYK